MGNFDQFPIKTLANSFFQLNKPAFHLMGLLKPTENDSMR
jgi:hypothetical protein